MRKYVMAGNWKMNNTIAEGVQLAQELSNNYENDWADKVEVVTCTPYVDLKPVVEVFDFDKCNIGVGAQNCYFEPSGAFTGEISIPMIKEIGCSHCIIGHSERREIFGETNEMVNKKAQALIEGGITPIICVGESLSVRDDGKYDEFVRDQVKAAFAGIDAADAENCIVAYEPIWAIGTGRTASPEQAEEVCAAVRDEIKNIYGESVAQNIRVLYGGSMKPENAEGLLAKENIDGGLIGGAALKADSFTDLIKACL
ncbi:MAG: triose-phosphate isomerase [Coriobacteriia bacterium]|nr:triose-phosphate isomerase [Coriobacteriia bacterium]